MFIPVGDTPNPRGIPWVTCALIALNVAVYLFVSLPLGSAPVSLDDPLLPDYLDLFAREGVPIRAVLANITAYDLFVFRHGFRPVAPSVDTLLTSLFLHGGVMHLTGNMLFLWIFGDNVEYRLGRFRYLLAYLATGVVATLFFALFVPRSPVPLVGASGAISGLLGFYYLWFPRNRVKTFIFLFPFVMNTYLIPARFVLGFYLLVDNLIPFLVNGGGGSGVAHGAHIGGFLGGVGMAWGVDRFSFHAAASARGQRREEEVKKDRLPNSIERIVDLVGGGRFVEASEVFFPLRGKSERQDLPSATIIRLGEGLLASGEFDRALVLFRRFVAERPADPELDRAFVGAGKAMIHMPRHITSAYQYFLAALDVTESRDVAEEARLHLRAIERLGGERRDR